jgi:hypothetical protein
MNSDHLFAGESIVRAHAKFRYLCLLAVLGTTAMAVTGQEKPTGLADARDAVEANLRTTEGKAYDEQLGKEFQQKHISTLRDCKKSTGELSNFWILLRLEKSGAVKEVLLSPTTKFGSCTREALLKASFVPPPKPDYWVSIYLQLKK